MSSSEQASEATSSATSLGSYLQWERQKKELSIEEVAEATRIPLDVLQAIEAGNRSRLPAPVFAKGFIKIYAEHLNLDQLDVLERYRKEWAEESSEEPAPEVLEVQAMAQSSPFWLSGRFALLVLLVLAALALAYFFFQANDKPLASHQQNIRQIAEPLTREPETLVVAQTAPQPVAIEPNLQNQTTLLIPSQSPGKIDREETGTPGSEQLKSVPATAAKQAANVPSIAAEVANAPGPVVEPVTQTPAQKLANHLPLDVHIRFHDQTHITVSHDNHGAEEYLFAAGEESSWRAKQYISVNVEKAQAVEVTVNGQPLSAKSPSNGPLIFTLPHEG